MSNSRDHTIDTLRGVAIFGVVAIHAGGVALPPSLHSEVSQYFRWAVPVFIGLFALNLFASTQEAAWRRKLVRLAIPFVAYSILYLAITADMKSLTWSGLLTKHFTGYGWSGQYFFVLLFQLLPIAMFLRGKPVRAHVLFLCFVLTAAAYLGAPALFDRFIVLSKIGDRLFLYWLPYFLLGIYLAQHGQGALFAVPRLRWPARLLCVAAPLLTIVIAPHFPSATPYLSVGVLASTLLIFIAFRAALDGVAGGPLAYLGRNSLVVFCLNPLAVIALSSQQGKITSYLAGGSIVLLAIAWLILNVLICAACVGSGFLLRRAGLGALAR